MILTSVASCPKWEVDNLGRVFIGGVQEARNYKQTREREIGEKIPALFDFDGL